MTSRAERKAARKARRAAKPEPSNGQQIFALMGGYFLGVAVFASIAYLLIRNVPA